MSKMGAFVLECQTLAEDYYNEPEEVIVEAVNKTFGKEPKWQRDYAVETVLGYVKEIEGDMNNVWGSPF